MAYYDAQAREETLAPATYRPAVFDDCFEEINGKVVDRRVSRFKTQLRRS